ncbi:hypothetical protein TNCV_812101 [Trichonephila clavipes]|nr:hypothetical protein TNCV_812101 [Trichonephila clavipes]
MSIPIYVSAEVHEQMSRFGGLSEDRPSVFKTPSKLGTHLSTQSGGDERQSRPCPDKNTGFPASHKTSCQSPAMWLPPSLIIFQDVKPLKGEKDFRKDSNEVVGEFCDLPIRRDVLWTHPWCLKGVLFGGERGRRKKKERGDGKRERRRKKKRKETEKEKEKSWGGLFQIVSLLKLNPQIPKIVPPLEKKTGKKTRIMDIPDSICH